MVTRSLSVLEKLISDDNDDHPCLMAQINVLRYAFKDKRLNITRKRFSLVVDFFTTRFRSNWEFW